MSKRHYTWKAVDTSGKIRNDVWEGNNLLEVQTHLRKLGYFPIRIKPSPQRLSLQSLMKSEVQWSHFSRRLSTLLEAGVPLLQALEILSIPGKGLSLEQEQWRNVKEQVEAGSDLSKALCTLNNSPDPFVISMIKVGESTGTLGKVLNEVADELDQKKVYRQKLHAVMVYPALLLSAVVIVLYALSKWILPMYEKLFLSMNAELPYLTKVIFAGGRILPVLLWSVFVLIMFSVLIVKFLHPHNWKQILKRLLQWVPLFGKVFRLNDLAQFSRILARLLASGIPLLEALSLTAGTLKSSEMVELTNQLVLNVRQGKRITPILRTNRVFPKEGAEMIAVAEEAGQLEHMLDYVSKLFHREFEEQLGSLTRMIEPVLILAIAGLIGLVAGGVMLPIFDLSSHLE